MIDAAVHLAVIVAFAFSMQAFMQTLQGYRRKSWQSEPEYSATAGRIGYEYKMVAWALLTIALFWQVLDSFIQLFASL